MPTSHAFKAGWFDKLAGAPTPEKYERCRTGVALAYERGRHCAALYEWDCQQRGSTITQDQLADSGPPPKAMPIPPMFAYAYKRMSKELRALIRAEKKFCSLKPRKWSV